MYSKYFPRIEMFQRIAGLIVTAAGVVLALLIGFWALVFLGVIAIVGAIVYLVRTQAWRRPRKRARGVIEGEFEVLDDDKKQGGTQDHQ